MMSKKVFVVQITMSNRHYFIGKKGLAISLTEAKRYKRRAKALKDAIRFREERIKGGFIYRDATVKVVDLMTRCFTTKSLQNALNFKVL